MATSSKGPATFMDGVNAAMQDIAGAMGAPDADVHFGGEMIKVMSMYAQAKHGGQGAAPGGQPGGQPPGPPGGGGDGAGPAGGPTPGGPPPGGSAGGSPQNAQMKSTQPPSGPQEPGSGPTPGLTPNPDEMRRVLQQVAGK